MRSDSISDGLGVSDCEFAREEVISSIAHLQRSKSVWDKDKTPRRPIVRREGAAGGLVRTRGRNALLQNGVFESLGRAEADNRLGLDLYCFASGRIATHAGFAVCFHRATDAGDDELA